MTSLRLMVLSFLVFGYGCNHAQTMEKSNSENYNRLKSEFDPSLTNHFPKKLIYENGQENDIISYTSSKRNNVGIFLYQYYVDSTQLETLKDVKSIAQYHSYDTCLLIVNRFETQHTFEYDIERIVSDSSLINKDCYNEMLPVPKFIQFNGRSTTSCGLDNTFAIYVLEANPGKYFEKYNLEPFDQMPKKWANGYSKGIAISKQNRTVIYWSIIW